MRLELNPGIAGRGDAAFVNGVFDRTGFRGLKNPKPDPGGGEQEQGERDGHRGKQGKKRVGMLAHSDAVKIWDAGANLNLESDVFLAESNA
jgi:hypothetical protein